MTLGGVPLRTGNMLARNHGVPSDPEHALEIAVTGAVRNLYMGRRCEVTVAVNPGALLLKVRAWDR